MMKRECEKEFKKMKKSKSSFMTTLLKAEEDGHVTGIKKRMDPTIKYRL